MTALLETPDQRHFQAQLIARAWYDESFKERLLADPKAAIEQELDLKLPKDLQVTVLEETPDTLVLLLPCKGRSIFGDHGNGSARSTDRNACAAGSARDLRAELIVKANQDGAFREELLTNPRRAIEKEFGIVLPEHLRVTVSEDTPTHHVLLLPINRTVLAEEPLNRPVGGTTGDCASNCCDTSTASASNSSASATFSGNTSGACCALTLSSSGPSCSSSSSSNCCW
jgi:hypothetical protein